MNTDALWHAQRYSRPAPNGGSKVAGDCRLYCRPGQHLDTNGRLLQHTLDNAALWSAGMATLRDQSYSDEAVAAGTQAMGRSGRLTSVRKQSVLGRTDGYSNPSWPVGPARIYRAIPSFHRHGYQQSFDP